MPAWSPQANEIFLAAIDIASPQDRARYVRDAAAGDEQLRQDVERLLAAAERAAAARFLETAAGISAQPEELPDLGGDAAGRYTLLERIGEGGFGVVYAADQTEPVRRRVAIKVVKPGMDSARIVARFEAERQALALMDHPNIAKVFDAGTTAAGLPFFVMELVNGEPITKYCDGERLSPRQRLELFVPVCEAVQHAHAKGVIHRDLKPSNVIVALYDGRPVPKVIDFGVAKALGQRLTDRTIDTEIGGIIGTLEYMAPEQAELNNLDVDTRADVYSLGVILYELLAGSPPFTADTLRGAAFDRALQMIRTADPPRPSTRLSASDSLPSIAANRQVEPKRLTRLVHGELDWIVMKTLEKERARRYLTANELAADVRRYLADEPVAAGPPSRAYRVRKFVKRHKAGVAASAAMAFLLVAGMLGTTWGLVQARQQRDEARRQRLEADRANLNTEAVNDFLTEEILGAADPRVARGREISVKDALDAAAAKVATMFPDQPLTEAAVRNTLAVTYHSLGRADVGLPHAEAALAIRRRTLGNEHLDTLSSMNNLGILLRTLGRADETEKLWREAVETGRRTLGPADARTLKWTFNLAHVVEDRGDVAEAERMYREVLEDRRAALGEADVETALAENRLGGLLMELQRFDEADPLLTGALAKRRRALGPDHPDTLISINDLGLLRENQKRFDECETLYREAIEGYRRVMGPEHPFTLVSINNTGSLLLRRGRHADAEALLREAFEISRRNAGAGHPRTLMFQANLGTALARQGKFAEAEAALLEAERGLAAAHGVPPSRRVRVAEELVSLYAAWDAAEPGQGHGEKASPWQRLIPTAPPATTRSLPTGGN